jgi:hypothetical protein
LGVVQEERERKALFASDAFQAKKAELKQQQVPFRPLTQQCLGKPQIASHLTWNRKTSDYVFWSIQSMLRIFGLSLT